MVSINPNHTFPPSCDLFCCSCRGKDVVSLILSSCSLLVSRAISAEEPFLSAVINYTNSSTVHFKLSPAYILYAASRFALQRGHSRGSPPSSNTHPVTSITNKMAAMMGKVIQASAGIYNACNSLVCQPCAVWFEIFPIQNMYKHKICCPD